MDQRQNDFDLLREFARHGCDAAFATLARRHLDLVYATALRKVSDAGGAEEIAQNVFCVLAKKAWQFGPDDSLPAWLYKTTLLESRSWLRGELRRRRREQTASELATTMKTAADQPAFQALVPLLDDALLSLREKDRAALLLRFYESQSLREVGSAFGVSEDTARKRLQSALEKLAEFFKERGFRTATVAAAAAALEHTAAPASAALLTTVVGAALQSAPPALVGLAGFLAKLASMSRVQTATVSLALAALPLVWQLNQRHLTGTELKRIQVQYNAAQNQAGVLQADLEKLQGTAGRLEQSLAQANEAAARAAESARAFDTWKKRIRGLLTASDYRWDDSSPFARIPKSVLPGLNKLVDSTPFGPPGVIAPCARELLGLSPAERERFETVLRDHFADLEARRLAGIFQTNSESKPGKDTLAQTAFVVPDLGDEVKQLVQQVLEDAKGILGEERWQVEQVRTEPMNGSSGDLQLVDWGSPAKMEISVAGDGKNVPRVTITGTTAAVPGGGSYGTFSLNVVGYANWKLPMFLPEDDPNRIPGAEGFLRNNAWGEPLAQRALPWLQQQAISLLRKEAAR